MIFSLLSLPLFFYSLSHSLIRNLSYHLNFLQQLCTSALLPYLCVPISTLYCLYLVFINLYLPYTHLCDIY